MHGLSKNGRKEMSKRLGHFLRLYPRRAQKGVEPNDRPYEPQVERVIRRLKPEDLDILLNSEEDERL